MERLFPIDPYNKSQIQAINTFEQKNQLPSSISIALEKISSSMKPEEFHSQQKQSNIIEEYLILEESDEIKDICHIHGEKDRKSCRISYPSLNNKRKKRRIILLATEYAMNNLGMLEVFINVDSNDNDVAKYLEKEGYENLGEEASEMIYLKEKETKTLGDVNHHETIR